ncbi:hypothetical protein E8E11_011456 [Didymella keratinophila]|nr:hypothetical protein E8E11_011456 [Didymella keratinophila]
MCRVLAQGLRKHVQFQGDDGTVDILCTIADELSSQTRWILVHSHTVTSDGDDDSSSSSEEDTTNELRELVDRVKMYINSLVDLGAALKNPALEREPNDKPFRVRLDERYAHDYHTDLIRAKFSKAAANLLQSLGQINWDRYQRMQKERDSHEYTQVATVSSARSQTAESKFQDSGVASVPDGKQASTPPLPTGAKDGQVFECIACGKEIKATNNRDWRPEDNNKVEHATMVSSVEAQQMPRVCDSSQALESTVKPDLSESSPEPSNIGQSRRLTQEVLDFMDNPPIKPITVQAHVDDT